MRMVSAHRVPLGLDSSCRKAIESEVALTLCEFDNKIPAAARVLSSKNSQVFLLQDVKLTLSELGCRRLGPRVGWLVGCSIAANK